MVKDYKDKLPAKTLDEDSPFIYWVEAVRHNNFDTNENEVHNKFNLCLESVVKTYNIMRMVKIKEVWNFNDSILVTRNRMTAEGTLKYYQALDSVLKFNINKRK